MVGLFALAACGGGASEPADGQAPSQKSDSDTSAASGDEGGEEQEDANWNGKTAMVEMKKGMFAPVDIKVAKGTKVEWTNAESEIHNVVVNSLQVQSTPIPQGASFSYVFEKPGKYEYVCAYHAPEMAGTVTVKVK